MTVIGEELGGFYFKLSANIDTAPAKTSMDALERDVEKLAAGLQDKLKVSVPNEYSSFVRNNLNEMRTNAGLPAHPSPDLADLRGRAANYQLPPEQKSSVVEQMEREQVELLARSKRLIEDTLTPTERRNQQMAELNRLLDTTNEKTGKAFINQEQYNRAVKRLDTNPYAEMSSNVSQATGTLAVFGAAMTAAFGKASHSAMAAAGAYEKAAISFETMLGSAERGKATLDTFSKFAAETPFEMPEIEQVGRGLIMFGEDSKSLMQTLKMLGDSAAGTSSSFGMIGTVYNQIRGVGHLLTGDFRQLSTRGIISLTDIAKHYKVTEAAAQTMISHSKISFEDFRKIMLGLTTDGGRFANMMERQSQTMEGLTSTLKDNWRMALRDIGQEMLPVSKGLIQIGIDGLKAAEGLDPLTKKFLAFTLLGGTTVGGALTSVSGMAFGVNQLTQAYTNLGPILEKTTTGQWLFNHAAGAGQTAFKGLAGAAAFFVGLEVGESLYDWYNAGTAAAKATENLREQVGQLGGIDLSEASGKDLDKYGKQLTAQIEKTKKHIEEMQGKQKTSWYEWALPITAYGKSVKGQEGIDDSKARLADLQEANDAVIKQQAKLFDFKPPESWVERGDTSELEGLKQTSMELMKKADTYKMTAIEAAELEYQIGVNKKIYGEEEAALRKYNLELMKSNDVKTKAWDAEKSADKVLRGYQNQIEAIGKTTIQQKVLGWQMEENADRSKKYTNDHIADMAREARAFEIAKAKQEMKTPLEKRRELEAENKREGLVYAITMQHAQMRAARRQLDPNVKLGEDVENQLDLLQNAPDLLQRQMNLWAGISDPIKEAKDQAEAYAREMAKAGRAGEWREAQTEAWKRSLNPLKDLETQIGLIDVKFAQTGDVDLRNEALRQLNRSVTDSLSPVASYADRVRDLDYRHQHAGLSQEDYDRSMKDAKKTLGQLTEAEIEQIAAQTRKMDVLRAGTDAFRQMQQYTLEFLAINTKAGNQMLEAERLTGISPGLEMIRANQQADEFQQAPPVIPEITAEISSVWEDMLTPDLRPSVGDVGNTERSPSDLLEEVVVLLQRQLDKEGLVVYGSDLASRG